VAELLPIARRRPVGRRGHPSIRTSHHCKHGSG
jgi:hypothetical protein